MKRIEEVQVLQNEGYTGRQQHGFKKHSSTSTAGLTIQTIISKAIKNYKHAVMASLDISSAFNVMSIPLLLKTLASP